MVMYCIRYQGIVVSEASFSDYGASGKLYIK